MRKVQILGTGCPKCEQLARNTEAAVRELGIEVQIEKITDLGEIIKLGVMLTPALAVDGQVKIVGKVPTSNEIKALLT